MDERRKLTIWIDATYRYLVASTLSGILPLFIVTEYPKSGGSWVGQMLADYLDVPFPRNQCPSLGSAVYHAHYLHTPVLKNVTCVMRDGRDVMVSYYFHMLFENERSAPTLVRANRNALRFEDYTDVKKNLPRFMKYVFAREKASVSPTRFTWPRFVRSWIDKDVVIVKYEDLVNDGVSTMERVLFRLTGTEVDIPRLTEVIRHNSFAVQSGRSPGAEQTGSFLRKGIPGDWREKFSRPAAELFDRLAGAELELLGYEHDKSWIERLQ